MQGNFFLSSFQFEKSYLKCITGQGPPPPHPPFYTEKIDLLIKFFNKT